MTSEMTLADYWRIVKRRFGYIIVPLLAVMIGAHYYANSLPEIYATSARIEIQKNTIRQGMGLQRSFVSPVEKSTLELLAKSDPVSQLAARKLQEGRNSPYRNQDAKDLAASIKGTVSVSSLENSNILEVSATGRDRQLITDYCNAYAEAAVEHYDMERRKSVDELRSFLTGQIEIYNQRVQVLEDSLMQKKGVPGYSDDKIQPWMNSGYDAAAHLEEIERQLRELDEAEATLTAQKRALDQALNGGDVEAVVGVINDPLLTTTWQQLMQKRAELTSLLARFTPSYPSVVRAREDVMALEQRVMGKVQTLGKTRRAELEERGEKIAATRMGLIVEQDATAKAIKALPDRLREERGLERQLRVATSVAEMFRSRLDDLNISLSTPSDKLSLLDRAKCPDVPIAPEKRNILTIGSVIGLLLGLALAFLIEAVDTSLTALRDVERVVGKPILAVIPKIRIAPEKYADKVAPSVKRELMRNVPLLVDQRSPAAEAYRTLRTVLQSKFFASGFKSLLVTSATPQEGKTTTIVNLSLACADAGRKTILVGANMRHPVLGRHFPIDRSRGLHEVLLGRMALDEVIQSTGYENLSIIDSGSFARRPAELLVRREFEAMLAQLKERYDVVLVDSPPTLPVADAATIAPKVDGVLLVYLVSVSPRDALLRCRQTIEEVGGNIVGVVFNDVWGASQADYAGYYYYHKYASDEFSRL